MSQYGNYPNPQLDPDGEIAERIREALKPRNRNVGNYEEALKIEGESSSIEGFSPVLRKFLWDSKIERNEAERKKSKYHK